jgi:hypothetical protein
MHAALNHRPQPSPRPPPWTSTTFTLLTTTRIGSSFGTNGYRYEISAVDEEDDIETFGWIASQANGALTADNVFDYFASSMFYDKQSNNQVLRMQTVHTGMPIENEAEELRYVHYSASGCTHQAMNGRRFTGVEFAVVHSQPPTFFIIQKRNRISPDEGIAGSFDCSIVLTARRLSLIAVTKSNRLPLISSTTIGYTSPQTCILCFRTVWWVTFALIHPY